MGRYDELLEKNTHIDINETNMLPDFQSGFYINGKIFINKNRPTSIKLETLAEELAHHKLTHGNIMNQTDFNNRKFENYARRHAKEMLITLKDIVDAFKQGIHNLYELANYFEVTERFVLDTLEYFKTKYGLNASFENYVIEFEPLRVFEVQNLEEE